MSPTPELPDDLEERLRPRAKSERPLPPRVPAGSLHTPEALEQRRAVLERQGIRVEELAGRGAEPAPEELAGRIEGFVGWARVPVGVVGPLRIQGAADGSDVYLPLATTEGSLLASYQHVANLVNRVGGISACCTKESVGRSPCFSFQNLAQAAAFAQWVATRVDGFQELVSENSRHCCFAGLETVVLGRDVYVLLEFTTGDAAGQNMVTLATQTICTRLLDEMPVKPRSWILEANLSGDKSAAPLAFLRARGKQASAEVVVPGKQLERYFRAGAPALAKAWSMAANGAIQIGSSGSQGNVANALAALFIACGQDVACVSEATTGLTHAELLPGDDLYLSVTLPNLIVGTVGGGTSLPTARECLRMLDCLGEGRAKRFAEVCAALALCGELALIGAMAGGGFADAHVGGERGSRS